MDSLFLLFVIITFFLSIHAGAQNTGVNYGLLGDNLPIPAQVMNLVQMNNIPLIRIYDPNPDVLIAAENHHNVQVIVGVRNEDLQQLSADSAFATQWVATNILPHVPATNFKQICAGNEVIPGPLAQYVFGAIQNLDAALTAANIQMPVTIAISMQALGQSYPPSAGAFSADALAALGPIIGFLALKNYPLLVNVYPYFAYISDPVNVRLDYALGTATDVVVVDGTYQYKFMLDAMVDSVYAALEKAGGETVRVVVSETGWPSAENGDFATIDKAQTYNNNVISHVKAGSGTPRRPDTPFEAYIFALFNENQKPAGTEQHFGLFYPDMTPVYHNIFKTGSDIASTYQPNHDWIGSTGI